MFTILGIFVLWFHQDLFNGLVAFEMYLDTILTTYLLDAFGDAFCVWDDYLAYSSFVSLYVDGWIAVLVVDVGASIVVLTCVVVVS